MNVLISLHDVAPYHLARLARAETLLRDCCVGKVSYLLIPDYHGMGRSDLDADFMTWCRGSRAFEIEWLLHGYYHLAMSRPDQVRPDLGLRLAERFQTNGEAEFLTLTEGRQRELIKSGSDVFERCLGQRPRGFVAPAWLFNRHLESVLREAGFDYTESLGQILDISSRSRVRSPVITWATRTTIRKLGSVAAAPLLSHIWSQEPLLRLALHPFDFDHPAVVASIRKLLVRLLSFRQACVWSSVVKNPDNLELARA